MPKIVVIEMCMYKLYQVANVGRFLRHSVVWVKMRGHHYFFPAYDLETPSVAYFGPPPQNCPFLWGDVDPHIIMVHWAHPSSQIKRHLDRFSRFCRANYCDRPTDRQTERQTDHDTRSVTLGPIYVHLRIGLRSMGDAA